MTSSAAIAPRPESVEDSPPGRRDFRRAPALLLGIASGLLLFLAFPPLDRGDLAWFGLVPLLLLVNRGGPRARIYLSAWAGGLTFWLLAVVWIKDLHPAAWLAWAALGTYLSLYWPLWLLLTRALTLRLRWPLLLAAPVTWVGLEYVRGSALSGFPWYDLAHSQHRVLPFIQSCDLLGTWPISFLLMMANAWLAGLILGPVLARTERGPRPSRRLLVSSAVLGACLAANLLYGQFRLGDSRFEPGPTVALLQSDLKQEVKSKADPSEILGLYASLVAEAVRRAEADDRRLDLIVWPETSFPRGYAAIEPGLSPAEITRLGKALFDETDANLWTGFQAEVSRTLRAWADGAKAPMLIGSLLYDLRRPAAGRSNAALLVDPRREAIEIYRKVHLVPFGEFVPLIDTIPWIRVLTPYQSDSTPMLTPGEGPVCFELDGRRYANAICFEDTVPRLVRRSFAGAEQGRQPDVLVNISNDGWFRDTAEQDVHFQICIFRAIENRVPIIRAVNGGVSGVINGDGRVVASLRRATQGVLIEDVPLDPRSPLYPQVGDLFAQVCLALTVGGAAWSVAGAWSRTRPPVEPVRPV